MKRKETGDLGERLAGEFLRERGYTIIEKNYRCAEGEVDIVARQADDLVFVEVRTKRSRMFGSPEESITPAKQEKLRTVSAHYRETHEDLPESWRIDVVAIELNRDNRPSRIEVIKNAVGE